MCLTGSHWWVGYGYNTIPDLGIVWNYKEQLMTTITLITVGALGFVLGLYVSSQIMQHIESGRQHQEFLDNLENFDKEKDNGNN